MITMHSWRKKQRNSLSHIIHSSCMKYVSCFLLLVLVYVTSWGQNIGIGTNAPQAKLHVNGNLQLQDGVAISKFSKDSLLSENSHNNVPTERALRSYLSTGLWTGLDTAAVSANGIVAKGFSMQRLDGPVAVALKDNLAFVVNANGNSLTSFNISNLSDPQVKSSINTNISRPYAVAVQGNYVYVLSDFTNVMSIYSFTATGSLSYVGMVGTTRRPTFVAVQGNYAYVTGERELAIFDVSTPATPVLKSIITTNLSFPSSVVVQGSIAYVVSNGNNRLCMFDVSNPMAITALGFTNTGLSNPRHVYVKNGYAYVTSRDNNRIQIFDVSNPASPTVAGFVQDNIYQPYSIHGSGNFLFVVNSQYNMVSVFDISSPTAPVARGYNTANISCPGMLFALNDVVAVPSSGNNRLCLFTLDRTYGVSMSPTGLQLSATQWQNEGLNLYRGEGNVGIGTSKPMARLQVDGSSVVMGSMGIGVENPQANLHVEGSTYLNGNLNIGTNTPFAQQTFANSLGAKLALYATSATSQYGLGIQSNLLQLYADIPSSNIGFGWGSSSSFTERARIMNTGEVALQTNGRIQVRTGTQTAGMWLSNAANTANVGLVGVPNDNVLGIYGSNGAGWGLTMNANNGYVGIGLNGAAASAPLQFSNNLGLTKISLYKGTYGDVGIGVYGGELRLQNDIPNGKVSMGVIQTDGSYAELAKAERSGAYAFSIFGSLWANGTTYASDGRFKQNIEPIENSLERVLQLQGVSYEMKTAAFPQEHFPEGQQIGLIAQQVEAVVPEVVVTGPNGYKAIDYAKLVPLLIESIKELKKEIDTLKAQQKR